MEQIIEFLKSCPFKISSIESEAKLYPTKLHYIMRGSRDRLTKPELSRLVKVLKKYGFTDN